MQPVFLGIAINHQINGNVDVGLVSYNGTYMIDLSVETMTNKTPKHSLGEKSDSQGCSESITKLNSKELSLLLADYLISKFRDYEQDHCYKLVGAGMTKEVSLLSPELPTRLWSELDMVPLIFKQPLHYLKYSKEQTMVDEEADSMARKCMT
jgi:hypothetical protein